MAATVIFAREDLSIPGAAEDGTPISDRSDAVEAHFFALVSHTNPDVIVLDFSRAPITGAETILSIRRRTDIPVLVVCYPEDCLLDEYRRAGAAECIPMPVDIVSLNQAIQGIMRIRPAASTGRCGTAVPASGTATARPSAA